MDNQTNNSDSNQAEIVVRNVMAKTYEEYKGAGVFADLLLDRTFLTGLSRRLSILIRKTKSV